MPLKIVLKGSQDPLFLIRRRQLVACSLCSTSSGATTTSISANNRAIKYFTFAPHRNNSKDYGRRTAGHENRNAQKTRVLGAAHAPNQNNPQSETCSGEPFINTRQQPAGAEAQMGAEGAEGAGKRGSESEFSGKRSQSESKSERKKRSRNRPAVNLIILAHRGHAVCVLCTANNSKNK